MHAHAQGLGRSRTRQRARLIAPFAHGGERSTIEVEHAGGTPQNPLSDEQLVDKFRALADPVLGAERAANLVSRLWSVGDAADVGEIVKLATPA